MTPHMAFTAFTPLYYRWEILRMLPVTYNDGVHMEPDVGQGSDDSLKKDFLHVGDPVYGIYGRRANGLADHIVDVADADIAICTVRALGASNLDVLPGPTMECHGRQVFLANDDQHWSDDWNVNAKRLARSTAAHFGEVINKQAEAWGRVFASHKRPYSSQQLLEEINKLMADAV